MSSIKNVVLFSRNLVLRLGAEKSNVTLLEENYAGVVLGLT
jgi:hypothetical protein